MVSGAFFVSGSLAIVRWHVHGTHVRWNNYNPIYDIIQSRSWTCTRWLLERLFRFTHTWENDRIWHLFLKMGGTTTYDFPAGHLIPTVTIRICTQVTSPWKRCWARDVSVKSGVGGFLVAVIVTSIGGSRGVNHLFFLSEWWCMYGMYIYHYLPTWMVDFYGLNVGRYTLRPMDGM